jgi:hypothetical protein
MDAFISSDQQFEQIALKAKGCIKTIIILFSIPTNRDIYLEIDVKTKQSKILKLERIII